MLLSRMDISSIRLDSLATIAFSSVMFGEFASSITRSAGLMSCVQCPL